MRSKPRRYRSVVGAGEKQDETPLQGKMPGSLATVWPVIAMAFLSEVSKLAPLSDQDSDEKEDQDNGQRHDQATT